MAEIRWTHRALDDLEQIHDFIGRDSPQAASSLVDRVFDASDRLALFPELGRSVPELRGFPYREILVSSYRGLYRIEGSRVWIAAVVHGRRLLTEPP